MASAYPPTAPLIIEGKALANKMRAIAANVQKIMVFPLFIWLALPAAVSIKKAAYIIIIGATAIAK